MSHSDQIELLAADIGAKIKAVKSLQNLNAVDNAALLTTEKSSLLGAINELHGMIVAGAATIDDAGTGTGSAWSASKVQAVVDAASVATRDAIIGGAPASYDTLIELMTELQSNDGDISSALSAIAANTTAIVAAQGTADQAITNAAAAVEFANASAIRTHFSQLEIGFNRA